MTFFGKNHIPWGHDKWSVLYWKKFLQFHTVILNINEYPYTDKSLKNLKRGKQYQKAVIKYKKRKFNLRNINNRKFFQKTTLETFGSYLLLIKHICNLKSGCTLDICFHSFKRNEIELMFLAFFPFPKFCFYKGFIETLSVFWTPGTGRWS